MADAAYAIMCQPVSWSGNFTIDEAVLRAQGISDMAMYASVPGNKDMAIDLFVNDSDPKQSEVPTMPVKVFQPLSKL